MFFTSTAHTGLPMKHRRIAIVVTSSFAILFGCTLVAYAGGIETGKAQGYSNQASACETAVSNAKETIFRGAIANGHSREITGTECKCESTQEKYSDATAWSCVAMVKWEETPKK
jgi:hypothetical protein